jgi:adenylate kinase
MLIDEIRKPTDTRFYFRRISENCCSDRSFGKNRKEELNDEIDICLSLVVEDSILVERLLKRGEISGRSDDSNVEIIENRIKEYYAKTAEVAELYKQQGKYVEINGVGEINEISEKLFAEVEKFQIKILIQGSKFQIQG